MEEILILVFQFLFEFTVEVLANFPFDWPSRNRETPERGETLLPRILWFCGGCAVAGLSLLFFRHTWIASPALRVANLIAAPITSGLIAHALARRRSRHNAFIVPRNHFWQSLLFTLGLVMIRFAYASRA